MSTTLQLLSLLAASLAADESSAASLVRITRRLDTMSELLQQLTSEVAASAEKISVLQKSIDAKQEMIAASIAALEAALAEAADPTALQALLDAIKANNGQIDAATADVDSTPVSGEATDPV